MAVEFSNQDIMIIYEHMKVELVKLEILSTATPNPIHPNSYRQEMDILSSITEKLEAEYPRFLDVVFQKVIREKAENRLKRGN